MRKSSLITRVLQLLHLELETSPIRSVLYFLFHELTQNKSDTSKEADNSGPIGIIEIKANLQVEQGNYSLSMQDRRLLNEFQHHFPLSAQPYAELAEQLGTSEKEVLGQIKRLQDAGLISRVGAVIQPHTIGYSTLAAMSIPVEKIEEVVKFINQLPQVNHNYERENKMNLWFVVTAEDESDLKRILKMIEQETSHKVYSFPMVRDFYIDLGFKLDWKHPCSRQSNLVHPTAFS